jgi:hypothetical protein
MKVRRKLMWLIGIPVGLGVIYFGSYLVLLHPAFVAGGGTTQRVPCYVNPFTGRMVPHHLQISYFFEPAQRFDAWLRPSYWCWPDR